MDVYADIKKDAYQLRDHGGHFLADTTLFTENTADRIVSYLDL